ncbi:hypothetical protein MCEMSEM22_01666 [Comamonadaceae bacterium]
MTNIRTESRLTFALSRRSIGKFHSCTGSAGIDTDSLDKKVSVVVSLTELIASTRLL